MTAIILNWTYAPTDNTGYLLQKSLDGGSLWADLPTTGLQLTYTDLDVTASNTYWYHVAATNPFGSGPFSTMFSVYLSSPSVVTVYLTVDAKSDIKPFDGTTASFQTPTHTPNPAYYGDTASFAQAFDSSFVGINHTITPTGGVISNTGIVYSVNPLTNTGSITGPPTGSIDTGSYVLIPPNTDLPFTPDWFVNIPDAASGSNGLITMDQLPETGDVMVMKSVNGENWTGVGTASFRSITQFYGNGRYVGLNVPGNSTDGQYSDDGGATWTTITIPTSDYIWDGLYDGTYFVACGNNGTILTSSNGADWGVASIGTTDCAFRIAYNAGRYVVVGPSSNGTPGGTGVIYTSTDRENWQAVSASNVPVTTAYQGVTYSPSLGKYLAVGEQGMMASSTDGVTWTDISQPAPIFGTDLSSVGWNTEGSVFAACDYGGYIYNSADGINWALNTINPHITYQGSYYTYVRRIDYDASVHKFLVFGEAPPS